MAASRTARIGLSFDKFGLENSWFLVDFSKHGRIEDVSNEIKKDYFSCNKYNEHDIVLSINNFLLPPSASSELFRENDVVSVRLECRERHKSSKHKKKKEKKRIDDEEDLVQIQTESCQYNTERHASSKHKKKNKKRRIDDEEESSQCNEKKKKLKGENKCLDTTEQSHYTTSLSNNERITDRRLKIDVQNDGKINLKLVKKSSKADLKHSLSTNEDTKVDLDSEMKEGTVDNIEVNHTDGATQDSLVNGTDSSHSDGSLVKSSRKRKRNRKRKGGKRFIQENMVNMHDNSRKFDDNDSCQTYKGRDVELNEKGFYGNLPDKLEPPKYYRHGYRNLNTYDVEPNKHIKFGEDTEHKKTDESTKQYNFLCKSRKTSYEPFSDRKDLSATECDNEGEILEINPALAQNDSEAFQTENETVDCFKRNQQSSENESFTAMPFHYNGSTPDRLDTNTDITRKESGSLDMCPVSLERKTLSSGVSVFVRKRSGQFSPRSGQFSPLTGFSKQEQLDTNQTNVSTVFVNSSHDAEFKVPSSPAPRLSPKVSSPVVNGSVTSAVNQNGFDFDGSKPLVGLPEVGDKIAYKVLELSNSCTPEVSGYKVAEVLSVDDKQMLELKNLYQSNNEDKQLTKFHVEIEDDNEILTNTENNPDVVTLHYSSLLETKKLASD